MLNLRHISLAAVFVLTTGMTGCNDNTNSLDTNTTVAKSNTPVEANLPTETVNRAVATIKAYIADSTKIALTVEDYTNAGITGVNATNLASVNDALKTLALQSYPKARAKIQAIVTPGDTTPGNTELGATATKIAMSVIATYALDNTKTAPTPTDYTNAGIRGVTATNVASVNAQLDNLVSLFTDDVVTKVQAVVNSINGDTTEILKKIGNEHQDHNATITVAQLKAITPPLENINSSYENIYQTYIASVDSNISSPATRDEVQQMITEVQNLNLPTNAILDRNFYKKTNGAFEHKFVYLPVTNPNTGRTWLNNNLGAEYANRNSSYFNPSQQATTSNDYLAYGSLFQWGREADGHELINWTDGTHGTGKYGTTTSKANEPSDSLYIIEANAQHDWRVNRDDTLWASESSANNVCPVGYRLPLDPNGANDGENEWYVETNSWSTKNMDGALTSNLKLVRAGIHDGTNGTISGNSYLGGYWTGSAYGVNAHSIDFNSNEVRTNNVGFNYRVDGNYVRCIKEQTPAEKKTSTTLAQIGREHNSAKSTITIAQLKAITPALKNINDYYENIYQEYIASADSSFSSPATRDELQRMIDNINQNSVYKIGLYNTAGYSQDVTLSSDGTKAYIADFENGLIIVDISDPAHPTKLGSYNTVGYSWGVTLSSDGTKAYVADFENGLVIVDISDPVHPTKLGSYDTTGWSHNVTLSSDGTKAYVADFENGLVIVDISDSAHPIKLGSYDTAGAAKGVTLSSDGTKAYVADWQKGLVVVDISDSSHPIKLGTYNTAGYSRDVILSRDGTKVYVADDENGLVIIDVSDPTHLTKFGSYDTAGYSESVALSNDGNKAYIADWNNGLVIIDVSDPAHPTKFGSYDIAGTALDVTLSSDGSEAYIVDYQNGLLIVNVVTKVLHSINGGTIEILKKIGNEHQDHNATITVAQLQAITPALENIDEANENIYRTYIASADSNISSPATRDQVQQMITEVNALNLPDNAILDRNFYKKTNGKFEHRFVYLPVENTTTGRRWLNNNLGAEYANKNSSYFNPSQQATAGNDHLAYGSLFQWGREADGHELINWTDPTTGTPKYNTTSTQADDPSDSLFITSNGDWRVTPDDTLWASESSVNSVCPVGYRLPLNPNGASDSENEWYVEMSTWSSQNNAGSMSSNLKLSNNGARWYDDAKVYYAMVYGVYWTGSLSQSNALDMYFGAFLEYNDISPRASGVAVRCIKDQTPAERSATILKEIGREHSNHKSVITIAQLKAITPVLENINDNYESSYRHHIASANTHFSSPATRDEVQSMIDIVNQNPVYKVGSYDTAGYAEGLTLSSDGTKAYVADWNNNLLIIDISNPAHLTKLGSYDTAGGSQDVTLSSDGTKAYVADRDNGLVIVDVSDPYHPTKLGSYDTAGIARHITLSNDNSKAYVADWNQGLVIIDISDPTHPTKLGSYNTVGDATDVTLSSDGTKAYVVDGSYGLVTDSSNSLVIIDISDPAHPTKLGSYDTVGDATSVTLSSDNTKAYVADWNQGLVIVDISDPAHPTKLGLYNTAGISTDVTLSSDGSKAYLADGSNGLVIVDISDPSHPTKFGSYHTAGYSLSVTLSSDSSKAYVSDGRNGLVIVGGIQ